MEFGISDAARYDTDTVRIGDGILSLGRLTRLNPVNKVLIKSMNDTDGLGEICIPRLRREAT